MFSLYLRLGWIESILEGELRGDVVHASRDAQMYR